MGLMMILGGVLGTCGVIGGLVALGASQEEASGVVMGPQVPPKTVAALRARRLLGKDEALLAYHDATVSLDMGEVTFVTGERVVHARGDVVASVALADVTRVTHRNEGILGDVVEIASTDGRSMRVEIAPLNGGESYVTVLEDAWRRHQPAARITRAAR
jgi:hypothetical protein